MFFKGFDFLNDFFVSLAKIFNSAKPTKHLNKNDI